MVVRSRWSIQRVLIPTRHCEHVHVRLVLRPQHRSQFNRHVPGSLHPTQCRPRRVHAEASPFRYTADTRPRPASLVRVISEDQHHEPVS